MRLFNYKPTRDDILRYCQCKRTAQAWADSIKEPEQKSAKPNKKEEVYLDKKQVCEILGITPNRLEHLIVYGKIVETKKDGCKRLFEEKYINSLKAFDWKAKN